jgi:hypothetical protein
MKLISFFHLTYLPTRAFVSLATLAASTVSNRHIYHSIRAQTDNFESRSLLEIMLGELVKVDLPCTRLAASCVEVISFFFSPLLSDRSSLFARPQWDPVERTGHASHRIAPCQFSS